MCVCVLHAVYMRLIYPVFAHSGSTVVWPVYCYSQDIKMVVKQCQRCYSVNRRADCPLQVRTLYEEFLKAAVTHDQCVRGSHYFVSTLL